MSESDTGVVGHCTSTILYLVRVPYTNHINVSHGPFSIVQCIASHAREPYNCLFTKKRKEKETDMTLIRYHCA